MTYKPHISKLQSGSGSWGVYAPRPRPRIIGKNNTFRSFDEACRNAEHVHHLVDGAYQQANQLMYPITTRRA